MKKILALAIALMALVSSSFAVSTTVSTAQELVDAVRNGANYADDDNEIVLEDGTYTFTNAILSTQEMGARIRIGQESDSDGGETFMTPTKSLTIKAAAAAHPIFVISEDARALFYHSAGGTFILDGVTVIGPAAANATMEQGVFDLESDTSGQPCTVIVRNCVFTANDGSDAPVTDYSAWQGEGNKPATGKFNRIFCIGDDPLTVNHNVTIENSTIAFATSEGIWVNGRDNASDRTADRVVTIRNTFIPGCYIGLSLNAASSEAGGVGANKPVINLIDSLIADWDRRGVAIVGRDGLPSDAILNIQHSIIGPVGKGSPIDYKFSTAYNAITLSLDGVTILCPGTHGVECDEAPTGDETIAFKNVIILEPSDSPFRDRGTAINLSVQYIATDGTAPFESSAEANAAFTAAVPVTDNPQMLDIGYDDEFNGLIGWDSEANDFMDVSNVAFKGKGDQGVTAPEWKALLGGGDAAPGVPVELSSFQVE